MSELNKGLEKPKLQSESNFRTKLEDFFRIHTLTKNTDIDHFIDFFLKRIQTYIFFGSQSLNTPLTDTKEFNKNKRVKRTALTELNSSKSFEFHLEVSQNNNEFLELSVILDDYIVIITLTPATFWQGNPDNNRPIKIYSPFKVIFKPKATTAIRQNANNAIKDLLDSN